MKVIPEKGIEGIAWFGMTRSEVMSKLGKNYKKVTLANSDDDEDGERVEWQYNELETSLRFYDNHDGKLGYIRSNNQLLTLNNQIIIGSQPEWLIEIGKRKNFQELEIEDYESFLSVSWTKPWIELHVEYNKIKSINLGVTINDDNSYEWPQNAR